MPSRRRLLRRIGSLAAAGFATTATVRAAGTPGQSAGWQRRYGPVGARFDGLAAGQDGHVLLVGHGVGNRPWNLWLGEVGADGELRWSTKFEEPERLFVRDVAAKDGGYAVLLWYGSSDETMLVRFDGNGQPQWRRFLDVAYDEGLQPTAEGYLVYGASGDRATVGLVDVDGTVRWQQGYDGEQVVGLRQIDGGILLAGSADSDAWVQRVADDGGPAWNHTYGGRENESATVGFPRGDGAVYGGWSHSPAAAGHSHAMLVRVAGDGARVWRRTYGLESVDDALLHGDGLVLVGSPVEGGYRSGQVLVVDEWGRVDRRRGLEGVYGAELARFGDGAVAVAGGTGERITLAKVGLEA